TRHRRLSGDIAFSEAIDDRLLEALLVVEDIMRNADPRGDRPGVVDVAAGAARALAMASRAMIVELERNADHIIAGIGYKRRGDRGIDATRHGDDHARVGRVSLDVQ